MQMIFNLLELKSKKSRLWEKTTNQFKAWNVFARHAGRVKISYMCATHALQLKRANDVGGELLRVRQRDAHHAVGLRAARGPVLVALDARALLQAGEHDDGGAALLPHQPPEVGQRLRQRPLKTNNNSTFNMLKFNHFHLKSAVYLYFSLSVLVIIIT